MMVIIKLNADTKDEREVEIVDEKGVWQSGNYNLFATDVVRRDNLTEPHDIDSPNFLGYIEVDKEKAKWIYHGQKLTTEEQTEIAKFIFDYIAPDSVY